MNEETPTNALDFLQAWVEYAVTVGVDEGDVPLLGQTRDYVERAQLDPTSVNGATVKRVLDLSMSYLPPELRDSADDWGAATAHAYRYGFMLWVPADPIEEDAQLGAQHDDDDDADFTHPAVLSIQLYARSLGCEYVMLDGDGDTVPDGVLPLYEED
jgi:hypothetical protein